MAGILSLFSPFAQGNQLACERPDSAGHTGADTHQTSTITVYEILRISQRALIDRQSMHTSLALCSLIPCMFFFSCV